MAPTPFAHASEAEMSRILDFYAVRWDYEPHTFPILWNLDGDVVESFSPDFYLPDLDLYLEMTTLRQKLVRKKNRKLRRLRELYPEINIKLFYARDFRALMLKYGKLALADGLSGSSGQVAAPHDGTGRLTTEIAAAELAAVGLAEVELAAGASATGIVADTEAPVGGRAAPRRRRRPDQAATGTADITKGNVTARMNERADLHADIGEILLTEAEIDAKVRELGARISADYAGRRLTLVSVLKGSLPFMADLMRAIDIPVRIDLMEVSSYGGVRDRVVRARPDPEGPVGQHRRRGRPDRRGHHRHRADPELPRPLPARQDAGFAPYLHAARQARSSAGRDPGRLHGVHHPGPVRRRVRPRLR